HEQFRWLRDNAPVYRHAEPDGPGFWAVTRYGDVRDVGRDPDHYSSMPTIMIPDFANIDFGGHQMMITSDPPHHTRLRRIINSQFTPRAAEQLRIRIDELAAEIIDAVIERGECDAVTDIAGEMPSFVIAELLGIPLDGERLDDIDFNLFFLLLIDAGGDTTRNLVGGGLVALFDHPDERRRLQDDLDAMLPSAVDEMLRWVSPVIYMRRTATQDCELAGTPITTGDKVVMYYGSANRDERAFTGPDRFDVGREPNEHIAFGGGGPHFCLGSHIARVEIQALLRELLTRLPDIAPAGPIEWLASNFISGPKHLPVRFTPARRATA